MIRPILLATVSILVASCAPNLRPEMTPVAPASLGLGTSTGPIIADNWWTALGDPQFDRIVADALDASPTLSAALARVRVAQAEVAGRRADRLPSATIDAQEQRTRLSDKYIIPPPYGGSSRWVGTAQLNLNWTIDFWGRQAALVAQSRGTARAAALDAAAARLALTASVAQTYIELARAEQLATIANDFVASRQETLKLVRSRIRHELASRYDERAAEALLVEAEQAQLRAAGQREVLVHALAALAGRGADYYPSIGPARLNFAAALPLPETLPADLLARRPDLLAGLARVDAAAAGRKVARAAFYPNVNLLGLAGFQALGLGALVSGGALTYGAGPSVHIPIFEGGRLRADYAGATSQYDVATADYNEAVLRAVRDASDAISQVRTTTADAAEQVRLVGALQDVVRLDQRRTASGLASQLDILASGTRLLDARQAAVNLAADGILRRVQLVVAVGGGFTPAPNLALAPNTAAAEARP